MSHRCRTLLLRLLPCASLAMRIPNLACISTWTDESYPIICTSRCQAATARTMKFPFLQCLVNQKLNVLIFGLHTLKLPGQGVPVDELSTAKDVSS